LVVVDLALVVPAAFFPGFPSTFPSAFKTAPLTLSATALIGVFFFTTFFSAGALVTRPVDTFFARGLLVLALLVGVFLPVTASSTLGKTRGFALPVLARVVAIAASDGFGGESGAVAVAEAESFA